MKDKQLENKDSQIAQMQNLLDQQQRLTLQDKKMLEEYKAEIENLKSLTLKSHENEQTSSITKYPESKENKEKWWHLW